MTDKLKSVMNAKTKSCFTESEEGDVAWREERKTALDSKIAQLLPTCDFLRTLPRVPFVLFSGKVAVRSFK